MQPDRRRRTHSAGCAREVSRTGHAPVPPHAQNRRRAHGRPKDGTTSATTIVGKAQWVCPERVRPRRCLDSSGSRCAQKGDAARRAHIAKKICTPNLAKKEKEKEKEKRKRKEKKKRKKEKKKKRKKEKKKNRKKEKKKKTLRFHGADTGRVRAARAPQDSPPPSPCVRGRGAL